MGKNCHVTCCKTGYTELFLDCPKTHLKDREVVKQLADEGNDKGDIKGLIDDDDVVEEDSGKSDSDDSSAAEDDEGMDVGEDDEAVNTVERTKRKLQHLLDDDDLDLIEENLGVKIKRKKHSRLKTVSSDEDESCEIESDTVSGQHIAYELFGDEEDYDGCAPVRRAAEPVIHPVTEADEGSEESDVDDFIVDDNNEPINKPHVPGQRKKSKGDEAVMNLHDIFEIDIDFSQFEKYASDDYGDDKEMDTEEGCNEEVEEGFGISNTKIKPKKKWKKKKKKRSIYDMMFMNRIPSNEPTLRILMLESEMQTYQRNSNCVRYQSDRQLKLNSCSNLN